VRATRRVRGAVA
jgi:hypothetical protein